MNIEIIKEQVEQAMEDKQEFADLCFRLVPNLISRIEELEKDSEFLSCLEACGVDNWSGWDAAMEMFNEEDED